MQNNSKVKNFWQTKTQIQNEIWFGKRPHHNTTLPSCTFRIFQTRHFKEVMQIYVQIYHFQANDKKDANYNRWRMEW